MKIETKHSWEVKIDLPPYQYEIHKLEDSHIDLEKILKSKNLILDWVCYNDEAPYEQSFHRVVVQGEAAELSDIPSEDVVKREVLESITQLISLSQKRFKYARPRRENVTKYESGPVLKGIKPRLGD